MAVQRDKVIASAEKLVAKGKIAEAIKEYERLIDDSPNDVNTLNRIGDLWVRINNNDEAVKVFTKIADHYSKDGFFLKAIAIFKKVNKLDPSRLEVYAKLADLYAKQGLAMEAKSQYQVLADYYLKHGEPANALGIYRKITELDPNSINVHVKLADLYSQNNQTAEALKEYDRVGRMLLKRGMLDEAVQVFKKALRIDAKNIELVESLVTALLESRDFTNATAIVEQALDMNRDHPRLLGIWSRIQLAKGDASSARSTLERALAANPDEPIIRETLADIYLKQNNSDRALEMLAPVADRALGRGERAAALEALNRVLRVDAGHPQTLERLVSLYMRLNEETNILSAMNSLAEAHIAKGNYREAARVLEQLIEREPQNAQHRNKLQFVRSNISGVDTLPVKPKASEMGEEAPPPPPMPSLEIEEPMPSFDIDLDSSEPIELEVEFEAPPAVEAEPEPPPPPPPPPPAQPSPAVTARLRPAVEQAAADLAAEQEDDLDFITEHLTEAEVFAKYGLSEKAIEHLRAVVARAPKNTTAHDRLFRILLDEGDIPAARAAATQFIDLLQSTGDEGMIASVKSEFVARGHSYENIAAPQRRTPTMERPAPKPVVEEPPAIEIEELPEAEEEIAFDLAGTPDFAIDTEETSAFLEPEPTVAEEEPEIAMEAVEEAEIPLETADEVASLPEAAEEPEIAFELEEPTAAAPAEEVAEPVGALDFMDLETEAEAAASAEAEPFYGIEGVSAAEDAPSAEEVGEIDFYIGQELFDEARQRTDALMRLYPGNPDLEFRMERIETAAAAAASRAAAAAPAAAPAPVPATLSRAEIETELLSAIPDDDEEFIPPPPPPPPPAAPPVAPPPMAAAQEENLFADEDDFFDLAAELENELIEEEEPIALSEEEQSLEQIFKEFKKGVEQQLDSEDYDTHYNLGIAYKEMGLIDEAIGEFQLASKDPKRAVECASMLGLCFLEKGMPQLAIKWYRKGLEIAEITEEEHVGLLYDLGSAYLEVGDTQNAQKAFMEVYGMNTNYRDVVNRIKQLENQGV